MQANNFSIGVIDSGVGGLTVLKEVQRQLPRENIIYFGDSLNMPYGNKSYGEIIALTKKIFSFLEEEKVKIILLACNTISSQFEKLVPLTNIPLFDIIYPGCLAAIESDPTEEVGLIATEATIKSNIFGRTIKSLNPKFQFFSSGSKDLARIIEKDSTNIDQLEEAIQQTIDPLLKEVKIKNLLLGCTHYPIVIDDIQRLYPDLNLIDPAVKLVDIARGYLEKHNLLTTTRSKLTIYTSGEMDAFFPFIEKLGIKNYDLIKKVL